MGVAREEFKVQPEEKQHFRSKKGIRGCRSEVREKSEMNVTWKPGKKHILIIVMTGICSEKFAIRRIAVVPIS